MRARYTTAATKSENVTAKFSDEIHGETEGHFVADNKNWCLLKGIPIDLDSESASEEESVGAARVAAADLQPALELHRS